MQVFGSFSVPDHFEIGGLLKRNTYTLKNLANAFRGIPVWVDFHPLNRTVVRPDMVEPF